MSYWNDVEIIFKDDEDSDIFLVGWGKMKSTDKEKTLGVAWSNFPIQKRKGRNAYVVIPTYLQKVMLEELLEHAKEDEKSKIMRVLKELH